MNDNSSSWKLLDIPKDIFLMFFMLIVKYLQREINVIYRNCEKSS